MSIKNKHIRKTQKNINDILNQIRVYDKYDPEKNQSHLIYYFQLSVPNCFLFYQEQLVGGKKNNETSFSFPDPTKSLEVVSREVAERGVERKSRSKGPRVALPSTSFCDNGNTHCPTW